MTAPDANTGAAVREARVDARAVYRSLGFEAGVAAFIKPLREEA
jgi:hypothetical protein